MKTIVEVLATGPEGVWLMFPRAFPGWAKVLPWDRAQNLPDWNGKIYPGMQFWAVVEYEGEDLGFFILSDIETYSETDDSGHEDV